MKYSYNWLKELSDTKKIPEKMVSDLTMHSLEVEGLEEIGNELESVVVGKILEITKHPNADKLQIVKVATSDLSHQQSDKGQATSQIVCGAWNIKVGDKVPVALVGAKLSKDFEIKEAEIRGVKSFGMLCAADELGLGEDHSGIMILDPKAKVGMPLAKSLELTDSILEIKVLPDRAHDCLSHVGLAREITVLEGRELDYDFDGLILSRKKSKELKVEIQDKDLCPRYIGAVMNNIEIKESPEWLKSRLKSCGIKAINNVVDATNYVMLELGQPLHAFDAESLTTCNQQLLTKDKKESQEVQIIVRRAKNQEKLTLLDDSEIELDTSDLLITNGETPLALAGIMGGKYSGISKNTRKIILEAASFNATTIRKTRTRLNIKTESSDRFEKRIDPNLAEKAMVRVIEILEHIANGELEGVTDVYPNPLKPWKIKLDLGYANKLLGEILPKKEVENILGLLGMKIEKRKKKEEKNDMSFLCVIPTFRIDLKTQEDLIEEIGRIWGYDKIRPQVLSGDVIPVSVDQQLKLEKDLRLKLVNFGFDEVYNYSFYSRVDALNCGLEGVTHLELANPMNPEQEFVRVRLIPNLLKNISQNLRYFSEFSLFELGRAYCLEKNAVSEYRFLTMAKTQDKSKNADLFFEIKGMVEKLLESYGIRNGVFEVLDQSLRLWHPTRLAIIKADDKIIGKIGEINPLVLEKYKIKSRVAVAEIYTDKLLAAVPKVKEYSPVSKFPIVIRDISLLADSKITVNEVIKRIKTVGENLVLGVALFDIFPKDQKNSLAFHISFGSSERTLENKEVDELINKIIFELENKLHVEIRK